MSIPTDRNISSKEFDKLSKYKDLEIEIQKIWKLNATTVPVILGALGMIKKGTENCISKIPGEPSLEEIQKNCFDWHNSCPEKGIVMSEI